MRVEAAIGKLMKVQYAAGMVGYDDAWSWLKQRKTIADLRTVPEEMISNVGRRFVRAVSDGCQNGVNFASQGAKETVIGRE